MGETDSVSYRMIIQASTDRPADTMRAQNDGWSSVISNVNGEKSINQQICPHWTSPDCMFQVQHQKTLRVTTSIQTYIL